ncbi:MAG TPA: GYD domain-containing protein [Methylomirabilota bacterium]|nr:GYD domain-containing protein [Methylomirabilota bacterium]HVM74256.1 GYD domain-containing protein [Candidatus Saccharimonadales bacterium]
MSLFCHQVSFTNSAWHRVLQNPEDRFELVRSPIEALGGKLQAVFFAMDTYDVLALTEFPENTSPADISVAFFSSGAVAQIHTTRLLDSTQAVEAMRRAIPNSYRQSPRERALTASSL